MKLRSLCLIAALALSACSDSETASSSAVAAATPEQLYTDAKNLFDEGSYKDAVLAFAEVERQHPYSPWALHAQVMSGYASYLQDDYGGAISTLERFVKLHPSDESTPYAYYLIALSYYEQISDVGRDQKMTELAMQALREVVRRFPESDYARDALIKLDLTVDHLAGKEMKVGRYYLTRGDYLAAVNRFRFVIDNYQTTSHVPEALHRLVEAYLRLGVRPEAERYAAVLGHNFPDSIWYRDSYKLMTGESVQAAAPAADGDSWWDSLIP